MKKVRALFQPEGKRGEGFEGESILHLAQRIGLDLNSLCGGLGVCKKCRVIIKEGAHLLSPLTDIEQRLFSPEELGEGYRLACRAKFTDEGEVLVDIPPDSRTGHMQLLAAGIEAKVPLHPAVKKRVVQVTKPTLKNIEADAENFSKTLRRDEISFESISFQAIRNLPAILRKSDWKVTATVWQDKEIISVESEDTGKRLYGFAVDVGTTKLAGYLIDLTSGKVIRSSSSINPQVPYGDDVLSRISYAINNQDGLEKLAQVVREGISKLIEDCCEDMGIKGEEIYDIVAVGNTAMHHLLFGINPKFVALAPHPAAVRSPLNVKASELGFKVCPGTYIHALPNVAGFVGADAVADVLATEIYKEEEIAMVVDIGTNTEIILGNKERLGSCSCASGPAFEGARIKNGMRAATGAIETVWIEPHLRIRYKTIGGSKPRGICGSAMVDSLAGFLENGMIDNTGKINVKLTLPAIRKQPDGMSEIIIAGKDETESGKEIVITQGDIRELQLAKAAIYTGASILMKRMKISMDDLQKIFIAGAFGNFINPENARTIGMYPDISANKVKFVGNSAGSGARMALLSAELRSVAEKIADKMMYVELAGDPDFNSEFIKSMYLPHEEVERFRNVMKLLEK